MSYQSQVSTMAKISGVGHYLPEGILTNKDLEKMVDTNDEWIVSRTGISERRIAAKGEYTSHMSVKALKELLETTDTDPDEIDVIIVGTVTPDRLFPATACLIQEEIGAKNCWGFDLSAACSGFVFGLNTASRLVESGAYKKVVVIGASTGGPKALADLIPALPGDLPAAVVIVQHMPPMFTKSLAERLDRSSAIEVKEAQDGDKVESGKVLIAPGGYHMVMTKDWTVKMNQDPQVCGVRPSVDVLMQSVSQVCKTATLGVVLTGMGSDGTNGASRIKAMGGQVIVEHESTCSIYGMPKSVVDAGFADKSVPLNKMSQEIAVMCSSRQPKKVAA